MSHPCLSCGACCATFRVSFYWSETTDHPDGTVPTELTEPISPFHACMRGTSGRSPRCVALEGEIGHATSCGIYARRATTCRDFEAGSDACQHARARHGLPPLDWQQWLPQSA